MDNFEIPVGSVHKKTSPTIRRWLRKQVLIEKLNNPAGYIIMFCCAVLFAAVISFAGSSFGILLIVAVISVPLIYAIVAFPQFGIIVLLLISYLLFAFMKLDIGFPLGTLVDALQILLILGFFIQQKKENNWKIFKSPISAVIIIWILYNLLEIANPSAESRLAWVYTVRSTAIVMLMYFIFMYQIRTVAFIRLILKIWIFLSLIGALYAFKQEFIGFSAGEEAYLHSDPEIASLLFIAGHWRKFSIFSDPVSLSYNMAISSLLCICLISGKIKKWKKIVLGALIVIFFNAMLFSGTRGAYVLIPAALALFAILNYSKKVLIFSIAGGIFIAFLIVVPTSVPSIVRFQTAFKPSDDASYIVRRLNQKRIQPYILSHPMGGGLGSTGVWGQRFAPYSLLAKFPPDSGYVRVAVEMGWIGLLIFCIFMFIILKTGINNFYRIGDPELKTYCLAMTLIVFALNLGNYPQEALVQFPVSIYFYLVIALINVTYKLDQEKNKQLNQS